MFVDPTRHAVWDQIRHRDFRAFAPWVTREVIAHPAARPPARAPPPPGRGAPRPQAPPRSKHDPRGGGDPFRLSAAAFTQARAAMPWAFWVALVLILVERFEEQHADLIRFKHFRLLALDGTCLTLDRWGDLVARAGTAKNGKGLPTPQARLVLLQLPLVLLPVR